MSIKNRLTLFIEYKGISTSEFERICGLSNGFINNTSDNIRSSSIRKILDSFPELNVQWLKIGEGDMVIPPSTNTIYGNGANISGNNNNIGTISSNDISVRLPGKGYQKIINSDGSQTTIEAQSFDIARMKQVEAENIELRKKVDTLTLELINAKNELLDVYRKITKN